MQAQSVRTSINQASILTFNGDATSQNVLGIVDVAAKSAINPDLAPCGPWVYNLPQVC